MKTIFILAILIVVCFFAFKSLIKSFKGEDECCECNKNCKECGAEK